MNLVVLDFLGMPDWTGPLIILTLVALIFFYRFVFEVLVKGN